MAGGGQGSRLSITATQLIYHPGQGQIAYDLRVDRSVQPRRRPALRRPTQPVVEGHLEGGGRDADAALQLPGANRPATFQAPAITEIYKAIPLRPACPRAAGRHTTDPP